MTAARADIVDLDALSTDDTTVFRVRTGDGDIEEAILLLVAPENGEPPADRVACWRNYCQHYRHIKLDKGSGAPMRNGELVCANHGAMFDSASGECTYGPCEGAFLDAIEVTVTDGRVRLADDDYEFVGLGPAETDPTDLSSKSNLEF